MPLLEVLRAALAGIALAAGIGSQSATPGDDPSVLFVGNSLTERHDLPGRVRTLAADAGLRVQVSAVTRDGASLADHWEAGQVQRVIASRHWSFVVLQQGPSTLPESRAELVRSSRQYARAIRAVGGRPALLMVWPLPGQTTQAVAASYRAAAEATGATLIPAGEEWARAREGDRRLVLTEADGFHPSEAGTEIAARAVVRALWDRPAPAQVRVIISGGFSPAYHEVLPAFERATGITVTTGSGASQGSAADTIAAQLRRGVPADVVILSREGLGELMAEGRILAGTDVDLAQTPLGMAVRAGRPKPDIRTVDAFKQTLLRAKSVAGASTSGIYLTTELLPRLGIADELTVKITNRGAESAALVAGGDTEVAIQPVSELLQAPGVDFVGALPAGVQRIMVFAAAVTAGSKEPEAARRLIAYLASGSARVAIEKSGMEPVRRR